LGCIRSLLLQLYKLLIRRCLKIDLADARACDAVKLLIQLELYGRGIAVLNALQQKDRQERDS
jgi:hypothetical protein